MHQCPSPDKSNWQWGKTMMDVIYSKLADAYIVKKNTTIIFRRGKESSDKEILCFNDLYLSSRQGHWLEGIDNIIHLRRDVALKTGEPSAALQISERSLDFTSLSMYQSYCTSGQEKPTNARIKLFQRTQSMTPRTILNTQEVVSLLQKYSTFPIEVVTATQDMTLKDQIRLFNSFDILVTTHGSHLANGIFTMHPYTKAVVELVPYVYDNTFFRNYIHDLGFAEYIVSSGHLTPSASPQLTGSTNKTFCAFMKYSDFSSRKCKLNHIVNPHKSDQEWYTCAAAFHSRSCDTLVNITILEKHMDNLIHGSLCKLLKP
jgi:hypothetical protein